MRHSTENLRTALTGSFDLSFEADLWVDGDRKVADLPIKDPSFRWDASAEVEGSGTVTVVWSDPEGGSIAPQTAGDWLAPFGSRLVVFAVVTVGSLRERIQLGDFTITAVPSVDGQPFVWGSTRVFSGQRVRLELRDRMVEVQRDRFTLPSSPSQLASVWTELGELTGFPLTRSLPDAGITRSVVYEESRIRAVQDLAELIGGVAFMESDGSLSARPIEPGDPVGELVLGPNGTIVQVGASLSSDGVYNGVVIRSETDGQQGILAEGWVTSGPLRATLPGQPRTPFHRVPRFYSSPFITTYAQAHEALPGLLERYSTPRATTLEVTCVTNPLLQVGDVVTVDDGEWVWTVRLTVVPLGQAAVMTVTGDVIDRVLR